MLRPLLYVQGILLSILACTMLFPLSLDLWADNQLWKGFALSAAASGFTGGLLMLACRSNDKINLSVQQAFLLTVMSWVLMISFAALPFYMSGITFSLVDALFESTSGLTTTGSTVLFGLKYLSQGTHLWRTILQWLGGIGIVMMALTVLPTLKIGGMQLFKNEFSDKSDKILPRVSQVASAILSIYTTLTMCCAGLLWMAGMSFFDALCHAMTTLATGGFSTYDASIHHFNSNLIEIILMVFMIIGGSSLILTLKLFHGDFKAFFQDSQIRAYLFMIIVSGCLLGLWLWSHKEFDFLTSLRHGFFAATSIITTTGFVTLDYTLWGAFPVTLFFFLTFLGGCTGSTSGGIKIFRFQILHLVAKTQFYQLRRPHGVFVPLYNGHPVGEALFLSVLAFFGVYILSYGLLAGGLSFFGLDLITCLSGSASALGNVGPGLGNLIGPSGGFYTLPEGAKWLLMIGMVAGRLELFTLLILFTPAFWKK